MLEFKGVVDPALFAEFCDAADPAEFAAAARWLKRARDVVVYGETPRLDIPLLGLSAWSERGVTRSRAWQLGYAVARSYRELLAIGPMALVVPESLLTVRRMRSERWPGGSRRTAGRFLRRRRPAGLAGAGQEVRRRARPRPHVADHRSG